MKLKCVSSLAMPADGIFNHTNHQMKLLDEPNNFAKDTNSLGNQDPKVYDMVFLCRCYICFTLKPLFMQVMFMHF